MIRKHYTLGVVFSRTLQNESAVGVELCAVPTQDAGAG